MVLYGGWYDEELVELKRGREHLALSVEQLQGMLISEVAF
jgi:hypothetical protein